MTALSIWKAHGSILGLLVLDDSVINRRAGQADVPVDIGAAATFTRSAGAGIKFRAVTAPVEVDTA